MAGVQEVHIYHAILYTCFLTTSFFFSFFNFLIYIASGHPKPHGLRASNQPASAAADVPSLHEDQAADRGAAIRGRARGQTTPCMEDHVSS